MSKARIGTRSKTSHFLVGEPSELPVGQLPTNGDVLRLIWHYRCLQNRTDTRYILRDAAQDIEDLWEKAITDRTELKVPIITREAILQRLQRLYRKVCDINKNKVKAPQVEEFKLSLNNLFDICTCQCPYASCIDIRPKCNNEYCNGYHMLCRCTIKIPKCEIEFLIDQR